MSWGYTKEGLRCYFDEGRGYWVVELKNGDIRQATPEEIDEALEED